MHVCCGIVVRVPHPLVQDEHAPFAASDKYEFCSCTNRSQKLSPKNACSQKERIDCVTRGGTERRKTESREGRTGGRRRGRREEKKKERSTSRKPKLHSKEKRGRKQGRRNGELGGGNRGANRRFLHPIVSRRGILIVGS